LANGTILPDGIEADVAASGQSGFAAQGGLPGAAAVRRGGGWFNLRPTW
jgi:hypothetical protein